MTFRNEPLTDFSIASNRESFAAAHLELQKKIAAGALVARPMINAKELDGSEILDSIDPSEHSIVLGKVHLASTDQAEQALLNLQQGQAAWADTSVEERSACLRRMAEIMRSQRAALSWLIIREAGKPWVEADADVAEAIDFCDYYADQMLTLGQGQLTEQVLGEHNWHFYQPRGIGLVISPWNFPLAIPCGMTVASLVCGNATILKPAEQTSLIAAEFARIVYASGVPHNAFAFLPGRGETIGAQLVSHRDIDVICFTGSKAVGLNIIERAAKVQPGQKSVKKVIAEMGGKNAVIIDNDADLDEAIKGVLYSAFGFAGQKCSAASRIIAVGDSYEVFLKRLSEAASDLIVGKASEPSSFFGPVIDREAQQRILASIQKFEKQHRLAYKGPQISGGFFVPACIFADVDPASELWNTELFAPVLACLQTSDFETAVALANQSEYALTGGLFSRSPRNISYARKHFRVGNLYINRGCTGALVCRQPFGGFKMSGVGSKAGGPDYLLQFLEPRTISENTMRRGFSPDLLA